MGGIDFGKRHLAVAVSDLSHAILAEAWREMPELKAVRNHHVHGVNEDYVPHASQRMLLTAELFARLIHPEAK